MNLQDKHLLKSMLLRLNSAVKENRFNDAHELVDGIKSLLPQDTRKD